MVRSLMCEMKPSHPLSWTLCVLWSLRMSRQQRRGAEHRMKTAMDHQWEALRQQGIFHISKQELRQIK